MSLQKVFVFWGVKPIVCRTVQLSPFSRNTSEFTVTIFVLIFPLTNLFLFSSWFFVFFLFCFFVGFCVCVCLCLCLGVGGFVWGGFCLVFWWGVFFGGGCCLVGFFSFFLLSCQNMSVFNAAIFNKQQVLWVFPGTYRNAHNPLLDCRES